MDRVQTHAERGPRGLAANLACLFLVGRLYNAGMRETEDTLSKVDAIWSRLRAESASSLDDATLQELTGLVFPVFRARAMEVARGGRPRAFAETMSAAVTVRADSGPDIDDLAQDAWYYWFAEDGRRVCRKASTVDAVGHFLQGLLKKVEHVARDAWKKAARQQRHLEMMARSAGPPVEEPPPEDDGDRRLDAICRYLEQTRAPGGPMLCFRLMHAQRPPTTLSPAERRFLAGRGRDPDEFLRTPWTRLPVPREELAEALGYAKRNNVDVHHKRAADRLAAQEDAVRRFLEGGR